ncbi:hypothetical protein ORI20_04810 [Mycobacterium sp. CVI_P3]|uniref:Secreted protein n=1 Tax=Mycobacterium pinniadriaticum TaxID=2994102 RepID=A0ABT3SAV2_9MYCO|nr:hypothetical protein [Mycobacterium pinniadriaticum]MCX2929583.1 hypothetical protein [Mycobacterium pinniadriaticum]MCX2936007.1 hypothetical protein [Mycobacterium pinniadriaticum]
MRAVTIGAAALAMILCPAGTAAADPAQDGIVYVFGSCYDPSQPLQEKPQQVVYGCDSTSIMENMTWSTWGADGATGTGTDNAVRCQPNCAQGPHLYNPIVVHAWNPAPADKPGCPANARFYTDVTVAYPAGVPPWVVPGTTWGPDVEYTYVDGMPAVHFFDQRPYSCTPLS